MSERSASQIPIPVTKRASLSIPSTILQNSTNVNITSRPTSPLISSRPPSAKSSPHEPINGGRRHSLLSAGSRRTSFSERSTGGIDDPSTILPLLIVESDS